MKFFKMTTKSKLNIFILSLFVLAIVVGVANSARLPVVAGDDGNWGTILNEFFAVALDQDGSIRNINNSVGNVTIITGNLSVNGTIESTGAGIKFGDGSIQTRAANCFSSLELSRDNNNTSGAIFSNYCWTLKSGSKDDNFQKHNATHTYIYVDNITGRMWTTESTNNSSFLTNAFAICDNSSIGGYTDWRLPTFSDAFVAAVHGIIQAVSATDEDGDGETDDSKASSINMWTATQEAIGDPGEGEEDSTSDQLIWELANPTSGQGDPSSDTNAYRCVR